MQITIDIPNKRLAIDSCASLVAPALTITKAEFSIGDWKYLKKLVGVAKINYDTITKEGQILWSNTYIPPTNLNNNIYADFVKQLIYSVTEYANKKLSTVYDIDNWRQ